MKLRLGIIGLGGVSRFYVDAAGAVPEADLVAVCDVDPARLAPFQKREEVAAYGSADALLDDPRVDAVVLDTPVSSHVDLGRAALRAGRHVCCEKPLALTRADADGLADLARRGGLTLFTAFHRRYNRNLPAPGSVDLDDLALVELRYLERIDEHAENLSWYATPASGGGGCIVDNGPNAVDVVRYLFGDITVDDVEIGRSGSGVDVRAGIRGRLAGGAEAVIRLDWAFDGECKDLRVRWRDGRELHADMLAGFAAFKSSLEHEYVGVLVDFIARVATRAEDEAGRAATVWLEDVLTRAATLAPTGEVERAPRFR